MAVLEVLELYCAVNTCVIFSDESLASFYQSSPLSEHESLKEVAKEFM